MVGFTLMDSFQADLSLTVKCFIVWARGNKKIVRISVEFFIFLIPST